MNIDVFLPFLIFIVSASFTPGPNNIMMMTSGSLFGWRATLPHIFGVETGFASLLIAVIFGIDYLLQQAPWLLLGLRVFGALWLIWFGWKFIRTALAENEKQEARSTQRGLRPLRFHEAFFFQWVNPKGLMMATSSAGSFILLSPTAASRALIMGTTCAVIGTAACFVWTLAGSQLAEYFGTSRNARWIEAIMGGLLILMAVMLFMM